MLLAAAALSRPAACCRLTPKTCRVQLTLTRPTRTFRNYRNSQPCRDSPLSQRVRLLIGPVAFTSSVGVGTYYLAKYYKPSPHSYTTNYSRQQFPAYNLVTGIIAANISICLLWQLTKSGNWPAVSSFLQRYMISDVYGKSRTLSMLGSTFSHYGPMHLGINMYVLWSVSTMVKDPYSMLHLYATGGLVASLARYTQTVLLPHLTSKSLGASGAILAMIGYAIAKYPEARFSVLLVDQIIPHSFSAETAFWCIIAFDSCGVLFGWSWLDHAAHLGGLCYGYGYGHVTGKSK